MSTSRQVRSILPAASGDCCTALPSGKCRGYDYISRTSASRKDRKRARTRSFAATSTHRMGLIDHKIVQRDDSSWAVVRRHCGTVVASGFASASDAADAL